jgi:hypothetical protein
MKKSIACILLFSMIGVIVVTSCSKSSDPAPVLTRESLLGKWMVSDNQRKINYEVTFFADSSSSNGIRMKNFGGSGQNVYAIAYLSGTTLSIPTDELLTNGWIINGSGSVSGTTHITWPFTYLDAADLFARKADFVKE